MVFNILIEIMYCIKLITNKLYALQKRLGKNENKQLKQ